MSIVDQIVFERVMPSSADAMSAGSGYWAFSLFVGEEREAVGSAYDLKMAMDMAQECLSHVEDDSWKKGVKIHRKRSGITAPPEGPTPQPSPERCPQCGSNKPSVRIRSHCTMMCPPLWWKWVMDERASPTDEIECAHPWHDSSQPSGFPIDKTDAWEERQDRERQREGGSTPSTKGGQG